MPSVQTGKAGAIPAAEDLEGSSESDGGGDAITRPFYCHVVWCDQRAFKEASSELKSQLETALTFPVKAHKTAEKCIRLIQKKKRSVTERDKAQPPSVFFGILGKCPNTGAVFMRGLAELL
jgi:hypothetical protein